jgi:hypothetical protein
MHLAVKMVRVFKRVAEIVLAVIILWMLAFSIYELLRRALKPTEAYSCSVEKVSEAGQPSGGLEQISLRVIWPIQITQLWVKQSAVVTFDGNKSWVAYDGRPGFEHTLHANMGSGYFLTLDRLTGKLDYKKPNSVWAEGSCRESSY